jgi:hypothetical protein
MILPVPRHADGPDLADGALPPVPCAQAVASVSALHNPWCLHHPGSVHLCAATGAAAQLHTPSTHTYSHLAPEHATRLRWTVCSATIYVKRLC